MGEGISTGVERAGLGKAGWSGWRQPRYRNKWGRGASWGRADTEQKQKVGRAARQCRTW